MVLWRKTHTKPVTSRGRTGEATGDCSYASWLVWLATLVRGGGEAKRPHGKVPAQTRRAVRTKAPSGRLRKTAL